MIAVSGIVFAKSVRWVLTFIDTGLLKTFLKVEFFRDEVMTDKNFVTPCRTIFVFVLEVLLCVVLMRCHFND